MTKTVYVLAPNEDWIVDRFVSEWNQDNADIVVKLPEMADVIWLFADWCYDRLPFTLLQNKKVITTIHHIVPEKFNLSEFMKRDSITDVYHVPNIHTYNFIKNLTFKRCVLIPYWANQNIWKQTDTKTALRQKYSIPQDSFVIGSFQRDSEGHNTSLPKLEKGPDLLADAIIKYANTNHFQKPIEVVLGGWRRQYIMSRLKKENVSYRYFEKPDQQTINELYQTLDLYPVTARYEGGPQSLIECGLLNVPVVSRDMGMATQLLPKTSINDDVTLAVPEVPNVHKLILPSGYQDYRNLIQTI